MRPTQVRAHASIAAGIRSVRYSPAFPLRTTARTAQPLEPILVPKLRIQFADFPYLHCSIGQRLFTLETCCGYGYELARKLHRLPRIFKGRRERTGHHKSRGALRDLGPYLRANRFQGHCLLPRKENSSRDSRQRLRVRLRHRTWHREAPISVSRFGNVNQIPFRPTGAMRAPLRFRTPFGYALGSTDPCSTAVHMEPFSTSAFKVLV